MGRSLFIFFFCITYSQLQSQSRLVKTFEVDQVQQAVAVDEEFFYVINNSSIIKYHKTSGQRIAVWDGTTDGIIKHLNSGIVIKDKLYCSNSNFPESPMASSLEIFDTKTMQHIDSHSFGIMIGSATWIDRKDDYWWVAFAHYEGNGSSEGKGTPWTQLVKFDNEWRRLEAWIFPKEVIDKMAPYSSSGGVWGDDEQLYITGHDRSEVYVLDLPSKGYTLELIRTIQVPISGQGIAWDHWQRRALWGIDRKEKMVKMFELE